MNRLIIADSFNDANMFYASKVLVPDPFIFISANKKNYALVNKLEFSRLKKDAGRMLNVLPEEKYIEKAKSKFKDINLATIAGMFLKERNISSLLVPANFSLLHSNTLKKLGIKANIQAPFFNRSIKEKKEISNIIGAQKVVEKACEKAIELIKKSKIIGEYLYLEKEKLTSEHLRNTMEEIFINNNIESPEGIIVSSGKQSAYPHEQGSGAIKAGVPVVIDIFPRSRVSRYFTDMTRTVCKGKPKNPKIQEIYDIVFEAQKAAISKIKEGIDCKSLHDAVLSVFKKYKLEKFFTHATGHGVGIEVHENPSIPSKTKLEAGMVITIEPGLYIPGLGGVRIEDMFLVTKNSYKEISKIPKRFIV